MKLTTALKEWAVAIDALQQGKTIVLLRKGGIREQQGRFQVDRQQVLLYPTYEHQKPELLKSEYVDPPLTPRTNKNISSGSPLSKGGGGGIKGGERGWHPQTIQITAWAEITDILTVETTQGDSVLTALLPFHIWNDRMIRDRLKWKPSQPLYLLLLRTYKLPEPQVIRYSEKYGGCRSWIELENPISIEESCPVLNDAQYQNLVKNISEKVAFK